MEKFTPELEKLLEEKLGLYKDLNRILSQERDYILNINVDALWKTSEKKKKTANKIQALRARIMQYFENRFSSQGMNNKTFSLSYLVRILPIKNEQKTGLRTLKLAIENEKNEVSRLADENKSFVREYLGVIDDIMSVAVNNSMNSHYDLSGTLPSRRKANSLIHAQV